MRNGYGFNEGEMCYAWNVPLVSLIFLKRSLVFPILLFSSISLNWSLRKAFLSLPAILWNSAFNWVYIYFLFSFAFCFYLWNKHLKLVLVRSGMTWSHVLLGWFGPLNGRVLELWRLQSGTLHMVTFIFASWTHCACSLHLETRETKMSKHWS